MMGHTDTDIFMKKPRYVAWGSEQDVWVGFTEVHSE